MVKNEIYTKIPSYNLAELYQLYITTLFEFFETDDELKAEYMNIRIGDKSPFKVKLDIYDIIEEEGLNETKTQYKAIIVNPQKQEVIINGESYPLFAYRTEKERRKAILQKRLLNEYSDDSSFTPEDDDDE